MGRAWLEVKRGRKPGGRDFGRRATAGPPSAADVGSAAARPSLRCRRNDDPARIARRNAAAATVARLCAVAGLSRAGHSRWLEPRLAARDDADLRDRIQRLALQRRFEGCRRITRGLRDEGEIVNAKRVLS